MFIEFKRKKNHLHVSEHTLTVFQRIFLFSYPFDIIFT